jgi:hypothetical protein
MAVSLTLPSRLYRVVLLADHLLYDEVAAPTADVALRLMMRANSIPFVRRAYVTLLEAGKVHPAVRRCDVRCRLPHKQEVP